MAIASTASECQSVVRARPFRPEETRRRSSGRARPDQRGGGVIVETRRRFETSAPPPFAVKRMEKELNSARPIRGHPMKSGKIVARFAFVSVALLMGVASCPTRPWAHSFVCAKASSPLERLVCDDRKLAELDIATCGPVQ